MQNGVRNYWTPFLHNCNNLFYITAIASISTFAPMGSAAT